MCIDGQEHITVTYFLLYYKCMHKMHTKEKKMLKRIIKICVPTFIQFKKSLLLQNRKS